MRPAPAPAAALREILPASRILEGESARAWAPEVAADAVLFPESAEQVRDIVRTAIETGTRLLPAGKGGWLTGGGWGRAAPVVVSTSRIDSVVHYEPADLTLTAGAGMGMRDLAGRSGRNGQWLPADSPGSDAGTLGAAVACGVSGPLRGRYGAIRDNVLGLEVVTGDGRVLRIGGRVVKNVAGYDLVRLFTGSRGSLGVITRVSVRLFPRPGADVTLCFGAGAAEVVTMARAVCTSAVPLAAAEVIENGGGGGRGEMMLAVRLLGGADEVEEASARTAAGVGSEPGEVVRGPASAGFHGERIGWEGDSPVVVRLVALPDRLGDTMECARAIAGDAQGEIAADAMCGLVRVKGSCPPSRIDALSQRLSRAREEMEGLGGSMALSRAPRDLAERVGWTGTRGGDGSLAGRIKALFDPHSILSSECP